MTRKRSTLIKDFDALLAGGDLNAIRMVFDRCHLDARGGSTGRTALAFDECPDEIIRWLVMQGADLQAEDRYGSTPLHAHAASWRGKVDLLLSLGAEIDHGAGGPRGTALGEAARAAHPLNVRRLLADGADVHAPDTNGRTPLERCLFDCSNATVGRVAEVATVLLDAGAEPTTACRDSVSKTGERFEFHRAGFNPDSIDAASNALERLYTLFDVAPVARRILHDGASPIVVAGVRWEDRFEALWRMLVPSAGAAATVQGEVVRIAGRIRNELDGNGGINWDRDFGRMADAWLAYVGSGVALGSTELTEAARLVADAKNRIGDVQRLCILTELTEAARLVADAKNRIGDVQRLCILALAWVEHNPRPAALPRPPYDR